jgi:hypothetical protein
MAEFPVAAIRAWMAAMMAVFPRTAHPQGTGLLRLVEATAEGPGTMLTLTVLWEIVGPWQMARQQMEGRQRKTVGQATAVGWMEEGAHKQGGTVQL